MDIIQYTNIKYDRRVFKSVRREGIIRLSRMYDKSCGNFPYYQ